jgi:D-alanine-D-alanine ligase
VQALERVGAAFTGATSEFYEPTREAMKRVCNAWGVATPRYVAVTTPEDVERAAAELRFPLIVKHPSSYSSIGMTRDSRVETPAALRGLNGAGFGRVDIRVTPDGEPFFLEINPNCSVYYPQSDPGSADFCLLHDPAGHAGFTRQIVAAALRRRDLRLRAWEICPTNGGYGMFATRPIAAGERIVEFEQQPQVLVSRSHVEQTWRDQDAEWFPRYAWPLTDEVYVVWERDPESWKPINHACDPNAWLTGLDLVARRDVLEGQEITVDYATFCNELMPDFECGCGAADCRRTIRGDDYLLDFVERYDGHVSDYVARKRRKRGPAC